MILLVQGRRVTSKKMPGKFDCIVCKKTAAKCPSNKAGSLQCSVCSLWFHPPCASVEEGTMTLINQCVAAGMPSPWICTVCGSGLAKVAADVKLNTAKIGNIEKKVETMHGDVTRLKEERELMKKNIEALEEKVETMSKASSNNSGEKVLEEVNDRASRERNVVFHRCPEYHDESKAKEGDLDGIRGLFAQVGLSDMDPGEVLLGWRRLGKRNDPDSARPLLVIFKNKADREKLLERAPRLSRNPDEFYRNISIVPDLTQKQRVMEQQMFKQAEQSNLKRSGDQVAKNLVNKVLGRRGERVLRVVEMREDEEINETGRVVRKGTTWVRGPNPTTQKRGREGVSSPGRSPPATRRKFGGVEIPLENK